MGKIFKNYKSTIMLILSVIVGCILGTSLKEKASVLSPYGDLFLNLLLVVIVPLIFLNITTAIANMKQPKRLGKILVTIFGVFIITSIIAVLIGFFSANIVKLVEPEDGNKILATLSNEDGEEPSSDIDIVSRTVSLISVNDFAKLLSKDNIIALLVFSIIFGIAINITGEKADPLKNLLVAANEVIGNVIKIIMYYAPIGLCCYIASFIGTFGSSVATGFLKTFIIYLIVSLVFYFLIYTIYAAIAGGKKGVRSFWKNIVPATVTALGTCSSAACIPVNIAGCKKMGVPNDIAETTVPLGTSFHKDGSIIGSAFKLMFLVHLFAMPLVTSGEIVGALGVCLLATLLVAAVPIGGGTISEMLIISMMGFPVSALPLLTIIATIIDAPATVLNVIGDDASSMLVTRIVDGKDWLKEK